MNEKRFNCHVKFSAMPNGIMVLDYERHGDEQTVIEDISREKAHRVMDRLNELNDENEQLQFENNELKCALALDSVDYIIADGKKIDIPPYYEFEQRYDTIMHRREYDGHD